MEQDFNPFADLIATASPEDVQAMIAAGLFDDKTAANAASMAMANKNAQTAMPDGYRVGNSYVAASPLEHMAAAMRMARGEIGQRDALARQQDLIAEKGRGLQGRINIGAQRPPVQQAPAYDPNVNPWGNY